MTTDLVYSDDQAAAHDAVSVMLKSAGISLDDDLLMPPNK
jgi:exodeoxyribonuclease-5